MSKQSTHSTGNAKNNLAVALTHLACPICLCNSESTIALNTKLNKKSADNVRELHGKTVALGKVCDDCQKMLDDGFIALVEVDETKSNISKGTTETLKQENAYRTGNMAWLKQYVANQIFNTELKTNMVFVQQGVIDAINAMVDNNEDS